jgi:hypothetical protein
VELIDELPLGDPNSLGSDLVSQKLFDTQVEFIQNKQELAHLPYKLSGRQPNKGIWQILLIRTQNLANLADINSNLANLADMNSKLGESCRYELENLANLADMNSNLANLADMNTRMATLPV